jgi:hypothetical protein
LSYLRSLQRYAVMEHGEVRSVVVALKPGVGDHTAERFGDYELWYRGEGIEPHAGERSFNGF